MQTSQDNSFNPLTFVVGTGRCGSTMISNLLNAHPAVLSLSEFFSLLTGPKFQRGLLDGAQFWGILSTANPFISTLFQRDLTIPEFLYPVSETSRYTSETGVPSLLLTTLPHLTDEYEAVYDELEPVVKEFPLDQIERQYFRLFAWLEQRFGRSVYVERSGASTPMIPAFVQLFPHAKFVHIIRDGRDCALSMSRHQGFRLIAIIMLLTKQLGVDPWTSSDRTKQGALSEELQQLLPENFNVDVYRNYKIPIEFFGHMWNEMITAGVRSLLKLSEEQVITISYEQFLSQPSLSMKQMMSFIDPSLPTDEWIRSTSTLIQRRPHSYAELPLREREVLETACQPGLAVLEVLEQEGLRSTKLLDLLPIVGSEEPTTTMPHGRG